MAIDGTRPERVWCTGAEYCTIVEAYPYHRAVNVVDHKGAGEDEMAYDPQCSRCREEVGEEPYTMLCETCERFPAVAYVRIEKVEGEQKTAWLGQGYVCRGCLRRICKAMQLDVPLPECDVPELCEEE